ncbi:hypothetical protein ACVBEH_12860 [Roseateles sp. GG27B]
MRTLLLSGDASARVLRLAPWWHAFSARRCEPVNKLAVVAQLQAEGRRAPMVGDGINDAPVLARADASAVMGQVRRWRGPAPMHCCCCCLLDVVLARELALRTRRVIRQNLAWAAGYNAACIRSPWPAAALGSRLGHGRQLGLVVLHAVPRPLRG